MIHMKLRGARRGETLHLLSFRRSRNFRLSAEPWAWIARLGGQSCHKSKRKKTRKSFLLWLLAQTKFTQIQEGKHFWCATYQAYWKTVFDTSQAPIRKVSEWLLLMFKCILFWRLQKEWWQASTWSFWVWLVLSQSPTSGEIRFFIYK